jgi:hypothetical protein
MRIAPAVVSCMAFLVPLAALAADGWETVATGKVVVKMRAQKGSAVKEVLAEGDLDARPVLVQEAILAGDRYASFMPYVKESKLVDGVTSGDRYDVYTRLSFPIIAGRDFVVACHTVSRLEPDGTGAFESEWSPLPDKVARKSGVVRLSTNSGSWRVTPAANGRAHVVYRFAVDPGGMIPPFLADLANKGAIPDTFRAVEKEAKRLERARPVVARQP